MDIEPEKNIEFIELPQDIRKKSESKSKSSKKRSSFS